MTQFGDSPVDRRKARDATVTADQHYALSRRVTDIGGRVGMVERMVHDLSRAQEELRSHLMGQVDAIARWCRDRDNKEYKREIIQGVLTVSNVIVIVCFVVWLMTK